MRHDHSYFEGCDIGQYWNLRKIVKSAKLFGPCLCVKPGYHNSLTTYLQCDEFRKVSSMAHTLHPSDRLQFRKVSSVDHILHPSDRLQFRKVSSVAHNLHPLERLQFTYVSKPIFISW